MNTKELQQKKIAVLKEIALTPSFSLSRSTELHSEYDKLTQDQMDLILQESGYDTQWPIGDAQISGLLKIAFALGKVEQKQIYDACIVK